MSRERRPQRISPRTLADNPIGNVNRESTGFNIGGNDQAAGELLGNIGARLSARSMMNANARAMLDIAKVEAVTKHHITKMQLEAAAVAQAAEIEGKLRLERAKASGEVRRIKAATTAALQTQTQATIHTHGILDRMVTDFPDADLNFTTEGGQNISITRPKEASSESSEGGR